MFRNVPLFPVSVAPGQIEALIAVLQMQLSFAETIRLNEKHMILVLLVLY